MPQAEVLQRAAQLPVVQLARAILVILLKSTTDIGVAPLTAAASAAAPAAALAALDLPHETRELVELHQPVAVGVVRLQHVGRLPVVHVDAEPAQRAAQLLVVELARVVVVVTAKGRPDLRICVRCGATAASATSPPHLSYEVRELA